MERKDDVEAHWATSKAREAVSLADKFAVVEVPHSLCKWFGIWVFPKIGGTPPKWMVYNKWKTLLFNGWFGGKTHYFRKFDGDDLP